MEQNDSKDVTQQRNVTLSPLQVFQITTLPLLSLLVINEIANFLALKGTYKYLSLLLTFIVLMALNFALLAYIITRIQARKETEEKENNGAAMFFLVVANSFILMALFRH